MPQPISDSWRKKVVAALKTNNCKIIDWTPQAFQRWQLDSYGGTRPDAYDAIIATLSLPTVLGNETTSFPGQQAAYEFFFRYGMRDMYGKIALRNDGVRILILSAHKPNRGSL